MMEALSDRASIETSVAVLATLVKVVVSLTRPVAVAVRIFGLGHCWETQRKQDCHNAKKPFHNNLQLAAWAYRQ